MHGNHFTTQPRWRPRFCTPRGSIRVPLQEGDWTHIAEKAMIWQSGYPVSPHFLQKPGFSAPESRLLWRREARFIATIDAPIPSVVRSKTWKFALKGGIFRRGTQHGQRLPQSRHLFNREEVRAPSGCCCLPEAMQTGRDSSFGVAWRRSCQAAGGVATPPFETSRESFGKRLFPHNITHMAAADPSQGEMLALSINPGPRARHFQCRR